MKLLDPAIMLTYELNEIRKELVDIRSKISEVENILNSSDEPEKLVMHQTRLYALREKEHVFIKQAKAISGQRIWIKKSLREHYAEVEQNQSATSGRVIDIKI